MHSNSGSVIYSEVIQKTDMRFNNNTVTGSTFTRLGPKLLGPTSRVRDSLRSRLGGYANDTNTGEDDEYKRGKMSEYHPYKYRPSRKHTSTNIPTKNSQEEELSDDEDVDLLTNEEILKRYNRRYPEAEEVIYDSLATKREQVDPRIHIKLSFDLMEERNAYTNKRIRSKLEHLSRTHLELYEMIRNDRKEPDRSKTMRHQANKGNEDPGNKF